MTSNTVFWGLWKFALSIAVIWFCVEVGTSTYDAIERRKRHNARPHITPADAAAGIIPAVR